MSLMDKLNKKEEEYKEQFGGDFWRPEEGDVIEGTVEEMGTEKTQYRNDQAFLVVDGKKIYCNTQLESLVADEDVNKGDYIAIKFLGARKSNKTGRTYKNYVLAKETPEPKKELEDSPFYTGKRRGEEMKKKAGRPKSVFPKRD